MNIESLDLNRLLVLHAVLEERSVSRAAARLHVTPSAISNALARLRAVFGDPLVVRSGRGLALTPRAEAIAPGLREAIDAARRVLEIGARFDPRASTRSFALACSDAEQIALVPGVAAVFARELPRATLRVLSVAELESGGGLASSEVDAAIAPAQHPAPAGQHARDLHREDAVFVVRRGHPRVKRALSKRLFNELRHVDIQLALGRGGIGHRAAEAFFASQGLSRDVAVVVPSFAAAAAIAARTDWVAGMPRSLAVQLAREHRLRLVTLPVPRMSFQMQLVWHERSEHDPGARFFRALVERAVRARLRDRGGSPAAR